MTACEQFVSNGRAVAATADGYSPAPVAFSLVNGTKRRAWDSNPRSEFPLIAVFKSQESVTRRVDRGRVEPFQQVRSGLSNHVGPPFGVPECGTREQQVSNRRT